MEHIKIEIKGNVVKYAQLTAEQGYCFYDADAEVKTYINSIATPILDETELARRYIAIIGDADYLNIQLEKEREVKDANE